MGCFSGPGKKIKRSNKNKVNNNSSRKHDDQQQSDLDTHPKREEITINVKLSLGVQSLDKKDKAAKNMGNAHVFTFTELVEATGNFRPECFLGEGGFGKVYKGHLEKNNQVVAVKQLDPQGFQGLREFAVEVMTLSLANHPNLVKLIGSCVEREQMLLVYEYMPLGSLENHLFDLPSDKKPLDWNTRMKIAAGAAKGLEYLHHKMEPAVIYRDLKCSNILLDEGYHPKLSDFGLAKMGPSGNETHVSTRVMGTYGYCAPDYAMTGRLTFKSDIYSYGVVLLELITGKKALDESRGRKDEYLVAWAKPLFKNRKNFTSMADPLLQGQYPKRALYQALAIAAMCVQEQPSLRPLVSDVVSAINYLANENYEPAAKNSSSPPSSHKESK